MQSAGEFIKSSMDTVEAGVKILKQVSKGSAQTGMTSIQCMGMHVAWLHPDGSSNNAGVKIEGKSVAGGI